MRISERAIVTALALMMSIMRAEAAVVEGPESGSSGDSGAAEPGVLQEIIVSARRRSENLQRVPIAVSAFNANSLETRGITDSAAAGNFTPNVTFDTTSTFSGATSTFQGFIRGIGQTDFAINTDPGVGVYVDGVYFARTVGSVIDLMDVESVEVLKGPQGTLFGRNSIAGAVNVTTRRPSNEFGYQAELKVGNDNQIYTQAAVNLPLVDNTLLASIAFTTHDRDGYQKRIAFNDPTVVNIPSVANTFTTNSSNNGEPGAENNQTLRGKLLWVASDTVELTTSADYSHIRDASPPGTLLTTTLDPVNSLSALYNGCVLALAPQGVCAASPLNIYGRNIPLYTNQFVTGSKDTTYATGANFSNIDSSGVSLTPKWQITPDVSLKSISAFRKITGSFGQDIDGSPLDIDQTTFAWNVKQYSQEFQLNGKLFADRLDYTTGAYGFYEHGIETARVPIAQGLLLIVGDNDQVTRSAALFGETNYKLTDALGLVVGTRWTKDKKEIRINQQNVTDFFDAVGVPAAGFPRADHTFMGPAHPFNLADSNVSSRLGLNYTFSPDVFSYAMFSQGYKSGGFTTRLSEPFNPDNPTGLLKNIAFQPEKADNFEIGLKSELLQHRVRLNLAAFKNNYKDIQVVVLRGVTPSNENAAQAQIKGAEAEAEALLLGGDLVLGTSVGYIDAKYTKLNPGTLLTLNSKLPNTPDLTSSFTANYTIRFASGATIDLNGNYSYRTKEFKDAENSPALAQNAYGLLGAFVKYTPRVGVWDLTFGGANLTDQRYLMGGFNTAAVGFAEGIYSRPREIYVRLRVRSGS
jgi:iron complex outermembrane recepter protein